MKSPKQGIPLLLAKKQMTPKINPVPKIGIVVFSCDKYADLWESFFYFFDKYWPDCLYPVYLTSNTKTINKIGITTLCSNQFSSWGDETLKCLINFPHEYVLYFQDDYFLTKKINTREIESLINKTIVANADYLRLFPSPGPDKPFTPDPELGLISTDALYRTSLQCAIWKTKSFCQLIVPNETSWEFEINSPGRSGHLLFLSVFRKNKWGFVKKKFPVNYYYMTAVYKGKWLKEPLKLVRREGIRPDLSYRQVETNWDSIYRKVYPFTPAFARHVLDYLNNKLSQKP